MIWQGLVLNEITFREIQIEMANKCYTKCFQKIIVILTFILQIFYNHVISQTRHVLFSIYSINLLLII